MNHQTQDPVDITVEFSRRLLEEWLPTYCNDPQRKYSVEGYKPSSNKVTVQDARDFMRALDHGIVTDTGGGRFRMPQSRATEVIFWEGSKTATPRPVTLWMEPVITIAAIARLHLDYGWPTDCLGTQSEKWEFDLMAFKPLDLKNEHIAGEVKKSSKELDELLIHLNKFSAGINLDYCSASPTEKNAHKKWMGLHRCHAPLFWAVGPGGDSRLFEVSYSSEGNIVLNRTSDDQLHFTAITT
ncbi:hypothetical protein GEOBC_00394 [Geobacteraceae bacterium]|nr:hypothetical protein GEOBC_00394 [Geobacteraceae bacterium]